MPKELPEQAVEALAREAAKRAGHREEDWIRETLPAAVLEEFRADARADLNAAAPAITAQAVEAERERLLSPGAICRAVDAIEAVGAKLDSSDPEGVLQACFRAALADQAKAKLAEAKADARREVAAEIRDLLDPDRDVE